MKKSFLSRKGYTNKFPEKSVFLLSIISFQTSSQLRVSSAENGEIMLSGCVSLSIRRGVGHQLASLTRSQGIQRIAGTEMIDARRMMSTSYSYQEDTIRNDAVVVEDPTQQANNSMKTDDLVLGGKLAIPNPFARGGGGCNICGRLAHEFCDFCDDDTQVSAFIKEIDEPKLRKQ